MARVFDWSRCFGRYDDPGSDWRPSFRTNRVRVLTCWIWVVWYRRNSGERSIQPVTGIVVTRVRRGTRNLSKQEWYELMGRGIPALLATGRGDIEDVQE